MDFKGKAKAFTRTYDFLASILPYTQRGVGEALDLPELPRSRSCPRPIEEDLSKGILEAIDMDSYRVEKKATMKIALPDADAEIEPVPTTGGGRKPEPELDRLSQHPQGVQRPVRQHPLDRCRPDATGCITEEIPHEGRRGQGLSERQEELRPAERPHRARQGAGSG